MTVPSYKENKFLKMRMGETMYSELDLPTIKSKMEEVLANKRTVGVAANQLQIVERILMIKGDGDNILMINPVITEYSEDKSYAVEGCLSFPGIECKVRRHLAVTVEYHDDTNTKITKAFSGFTARVIQHEIDHLDGITMLDRATRYHREQALKASKPHAK